MTAHDPSLVRKGWKRWLGFGGGEFDASTEVPGGQRPAALSSSERWIIPLMADISHFLAEHDLPVTPFTLEAGHDIVTGSNPDLSAAVAARIADGLAITQAWLEEIIQSENDSSAAQLHSLILHLEKTIDAFAHTTKAASKVTTDYNSALEAHVDELAAAGGSDADVVLQITSLARDMLDRTREVARELTRSERETRTLQKQLADARAEAEIDHLTGLPNRRAFEARYEDEYNSTRENGEPLCVAFCDIDEFKRINDTHGHEAGDRVLRTVAQSLAAISDDKCHVARHGGEEFVVLLRNRMIEDALKVIDDARATLASRRLVNRSTEMPFGQVTFSAGVADAHAYADPREALRAADNALLRAKDNGRNLVLKAD